jgi:hypothetical protein
MGRRFRQRFHYAPGCDELAEDEDEAVYGRAPHGAMNVQVVRSVSNWSHGVLTEKSIQSACEFRSPFFFIHSWDICVDDEGSCVDIALIEEANHFIYIGMW